MDVLDILWVWVLNTKTLDTWYYAYDIVYDINILQNQDECVWWYVGVSQTFPVHDPFQYYDTYHDLHPNKPSEMY